MTEPSQHDPRFLPPPASAGMAGPSPAAQFDAAAPAFPPPAYPAANPTSSAAAYPPPTYPGYPAYAAAPTGRSTGAKVGIAVAVVAGGLVLLAIVLAVVIPVYLNHRAQSVASHTTFVLPGTVEGYARLTGAVDQAVQTQAAALPQDWGTPQAAAYGDTTVRVVVVGGVHPLTSHDQDDFLGGFQRSSVARGATMSTVDAGPLGGLVRCAQSADSTNTTCAFVDEGAFGAITVLGVGAEADRQVLAIRSVVEHRA